VREYRVGTHRLRRRASGASFGSVPDAEFVVRLADLDQGPKTITWTLSTEWLGHALKDTEASPHTPGVAEVELSRNGREVMVRGRAKLAVTMTCSRSLEPMRVQLEPDIFLLLTRADEPGPRQRRPSGRLTRRRPATRSGGAGGWAEDRVLTEDDAARDAFRGEAIVLDGFLREFILLELPMNPVRSDLHLTTEQVTAPRPVAARRPDPRLAPLAVLLERLRDKN
jgi:uncharacterized metal-binding protein YceD (DUF177 family)